jgi:hypothetical protein
MMALKPKALAVVVLATLLAAALGYWAYGAHKKQELRLVVAAILADVSPRMREALEIEAGLPAEGRKGLSPQLEQHAAAVDQRLQQLKGMDGTPDLPLFDAADSYVLTAREILRKQAASNQHRESLSQSLEALRTHMRADDRTGGWVKEAVVARERVDREYREYRIATEAFGTVLGTLTAAQTKIARYVDASQLSDVKLIGETRSRTLEALKQLAAEMEQVKQLESYR